METIKNGSEVKDNKQQQKFRLFLPWHVQVRRLQLTG